MQELDLLRAVPVHEFLDERDLRHVMRLYQVGGLSYGTSPRARTQRASG